MNKIKHCVMLILFFSYILTVANEEHTTVDGLNVLKEQCKDKSDEKKIKISCLKGECECCKKNVSKPPRTISLTLAVTVPVGVFALGFAAGWLLKTSYFPDLVIFSNRTKSR